MDKRHENKKTGYTGIQNFFIERQPNVLPIYPAVTRKAAAFNVIVGDIDTKNGELIKAVKAGNTEKKANAQDAMVTLVCRIKDNLNSIATDEAPDAALEKADCDQRFRLCRDERYGTGGLRPANS